MTIPRRLLHDDEDVVLEAHPHVRRLVLPALATAVLLGGAIAVRDVAAPDRYPMLGLLVLALLASLWLVVRYVRWVTTTFAVTTDRLIHRTGVVSRQVREIPLDRVTDITCTQSLLDRVLASGDLVIESGGERGQQVVSDVPRPFRIQHEIYRAMEAKSEGLADRGATLSIPEQIEKLDELRQRGVISNAEFNVKKQQLLDRM